MNIKFFIFFAISLFFCACSNPKHNVTITGKVENLQGNIIFLENGDKSDTIIVDKNGSFLWKSTIVDPQFVRIKIPGNEKKILLLIDSMEEVNITFNALWADSGMIVKGSTGTLKIQELSKQFSTTLNKINKINRNFETQKFKSKTDEDSYRKKTVDSLKSCIDAEISFLTNFIKQNSQSLASITALYQTFDKYSGRPLLLDIPNGIKYFSFVDSSLMARYPNSQTVQMFHQATEALNMSEVKADEGNVKQFIPLLKIGDTAPEFKGKTLFGKEITLNQFKGKFVFLDFWASWNKACRANNAYIKKMKKQYEKEGLEIIQIAVDINPKAVLLAIQNDNLPWKNHICDGKTWQSDVVKLYNVTQIPQNFLIDKNGKILEINIYSGNLEKALKKFLHQK